LWRAEAEDSYGFQAMLATTAAALMLLEPAWDLPRCLQAATAFWESRDREQLD
jgi:hypothetical protein